jgi:hypothetical protein
MVIAARARRRPATLVGSDSGPFDRVEGVLVANWV